MNVSNVLKIYENDKLQHVIDINEIKVISGSSLFYDCIIVISDHVSIDLKGCNTQQIFDIICSNSENKEYRYYTN